MKLLAMRGMKLHLHRREKKLVLGIFLVFAMIVLPISSFAFSSATLQTYNGTELDYIEFDRYGQDANNSINTYGSNSYMDYSGTTPNLFLDICHDNLSIGDRVGLSYLSENGSLMFNVVNYIPLVNSVITNSSYSCSNIDLDISGKYGIYPGYIYPFIVPNDVEYSRDTNISEVEMLDQITFFNGSYDLAVNIEGPPKTYLISVDSIYDQDNIEIENYPLESYLIMSLLNASNYTLVEDILAPDQSLEYEGGFRGGEKVFVNGLQSLDILAYDPCTPINESGYYIMTNSTFNNNETCVVINNSDNIVINFVDEVIDGDGNVTYGSKRIDKCAIKIQNSQNIVLENFKSQEFYYGVCIENSTAMVFGTASSYNIHGAKIYGGSNVKFVDVYFGNNESEVYSIEDSIVNLTRVNFTTADIQSDIKNLMVRSVTDPPELPDIENIQDIDQYIEYLSTEEGSEATIGFYYTEPLPNNMSLGNTSIYQRHGERILHNVTNTTSYFNETLNQTVNITTITEVYGWEESNWTKLPRLLYEEPIIWCGSKEGGGIITITNFSVFAPLGLPNTTQEQEVPEPEPDPNPNPRPQAGGGGGGGGSQRDVDQADDEEIEAAPSLILLELDMITENITLMQGEAGEVSFNLSNVGDVIAENVIVNPSVSQGWDYTNYSLESLDSGASTIGSFQIAPYEKAVARDYYVTVWANVIDENLNQTVRIISDTIKVTVLPRGNLARMRVIEYPPEILANPFSSETISFLAENIGDQDLENITIKLEDSDCIIDIEGSDDLDWKETKSLKYKFSFGDESVCDYNIKFYDSKDRLVGFLPMKFTIRTKTWRDEPVKTSIVIFIIIAWTALTAMVIARKRSLKHMKQANQKK